jgi:hypothetical protein
LVLGGGRRFVWDFRGSRAKLRKKFFPFIRNFFFKNERKRERETERKKER